MCQVIIKHSTVDQKSQMPPEISVTETEYILRKCIEFLRDHAQQYDKVVNQQCAAHSGLPHNDESFD